jgi:hypothetical protein
MPSRPGRDLTFAPRDRKLKPLSHPDMHGAFHSKLVRQAPYFMIDRGIFAK